jgi:membrane-bound metal-dependent hydrolase YbcI (DUF457 family)
MRWYWVKMTRFLKKNKSLQVVIFFRKYFNGWHKQCVRTLRPLTLFSVGPPIGDSEIQDIKKEPKMPLPFGHTAIGWAVYETTRGTRSRDRQPARGSRIVAIVFAAVLANLPDLDVLFGLIYYGNGEAIHRGPTHSLVFALLAGYIASKLWWLWRYIPRFGFGLCFMLIFSHVLADMLLTSSPVSLLWPMELYFSSGHSGWGQVVHMVFFQSAWDAGIVAVCLIYVNALRFFRGKTSLFPLFAFARRRFK